MYFDASNNSAFMVYIDPDINVVFYFFFLCKNHAFMFLCINIYFHVY